LSTVKEYVNLENLVQFNDTLTVEDIVQTIQELSEDELSENQEQPNISPSEALCALDKLVLYLDQNQENYSYDTKSLL
ncbi:6808_t:CDS:1, partial [Paraglomus brasilianum]